MTPSGWMLGRRSRPVWQTGIYVVSIMLDVIRPEYSFEMAGEKNHQQAYIFTKTEHVLVKIFIERQIPR